MQKKKGKSSSSKRIKKRPHLKKVILEIEFADERDASLWESVDSYFRSIGMYK